MRLRLVHKFAYGRCRFLATHAALPQRNCTSITPPYSALIENLAQVRAHVKHKLTLAEKILYSHLCDPTKTIADGGSIRGQAYLQLRPEVSFLFLRVLDVVTTFCPQASCYARCFSTVSEPKSLFLGLMTPKLRMA